MNSLAKLQVNNLLITRKVSLRTFHIKLFPIMTLTLTADYLNKITKTNNNFVRQYVYTS